MCALSVASQLDNDADMEWLMHYHIAPEDLHLYFSPGLESKDSLLPRSVSFPNMSPGTGLFTTKSRKANEFVCAFPGKWMETHVYDRRSKQDGTYAFAIPEDDSWDPMHNLIYVTHPCQANFINDAVVGSEVHRTTHCTSVYCSMHYTIKPVLAGVG
jgi:hypothetical protein